MSIKMDAIWNSAAAYAPRTMSLLSWRAVAVVFALANLKSLHFMWFVCPPGARLRPQLKAKVKTD
jgi:hypothetical protein